MTDRLFADCCYGTEWQHMSHQPSPQKELRKNWRARELLENLAMREEALDARWQPGCCGECGSEPSTVIVSVNGEDLCRECAEDLAQGKGNPTDD